MSNARGVGGAAARGIKDFDFVVIGAGAAGLSVTAVAAQLGLRVALIERGRMGGDCLNFGCVPSKSLLAAAHAAEAVRQAAQFGIHVPDPVIDWQQVQAHVKGVIDAIAPTDSAERFRDLGAEVIAGDARFTGPATLDVAGRTVTARRIVIAAGSEPAIPPIPGLVETGCLTNETIFDLPQRPDHLLILGGGPVGLELADAFAGLGSRVTVVEADRIAARDDPDLVAGLRAALTARGITLHEQTRVSEVRPGPTLILSNGDQIAGTHLLVAAGRRPRLASLDLERGQVRTTPHGIATDRGLRSPTNKRVFAVGDIADPDGVGPRAFTHAASYHAGIVIRRAVFRLPATIDYAALPRVTYTSPELAQAGLTEAEARGQGRRIQTLTIPLPDNDRARTDAITTGLVKLVVEHGGGVIGAGILAPHAGEMITAWTLAIARKVPLRALAGLIVPYPTLSESGKRAAQNFYADRLFSPRTRSLARLLRLLPIRGEWK